MKFSYLRLDQKNIRHWESQLQKLEEAFTYPLGEDSFTIDHGPNYLAFFRRIGSDSVYIATHNNGIVAVGAGVISHRHKAWYLCDMKVHPGYRGNKIPRKLFTRYFFPNYLKCQRGYALTMEDSSGKLNPIFKIMQNLPWTPLKHGGRILFYYEDAETTRKAMDVLSSKRSNIHFFSLTGMKDLILKSNRQPLPILHMEWGECLKGEGAYENPQPGKLHMWALDESDSMVETLKDQGLCHKASGSIFHHRMRGTDWSELRTSEL